MLQTAHIIDAGQGNILSVQNALELLGVKSELVTQSEQLKSADRIILPGVGHFDAAIKKLKEKNLDEAITGFAASGKPLLGICLGMQLLGTSSEEGKSEGLRLLSGKVVAMTTLDTFRYKIPHNGWNNLVEMNSSRLLKGVTSEDYFFFLHGYKWHSDIRSEILALASYETNFPAVAGRDNVFGVQFHPEKSHDSGLKILKNFLAI